MNLRAVLLSQGQGSDWVNKDIFLLIRSSYTDSGLFFCRRSLTWIRVHPYISFQKRLLDLPTTSGKSPKSFFCCVKKFFR